jgi:hypothetical protein
MLTGGHKEKRDFFRMRIDSDLTYTISGQDRTFKGFCRNLSHTGIQFETTGPVEEGLIIEITLSSKDKRINPVKADTQVLRVEKTDDKQYTVSGKILEFK